MRRPDLGGDLLTLASGRQSADQPYKIALTVDDPDGGAWEMPVKPLSTEPSTGNHCALPVPSGDRHDRNDGGEEERPSPDEEGGGVAVGERPGRTIDGHYIAVDGSNRLLRPPQLGSAPGTG